MLACRKMAEHWEGWMAWDEVVRRRNGLSVFC